MGRLVTQRSAQRGRPAVPDHWTGRPGGSGAQPPLHLIYMVKVGPHLITSFLPSFQNFYEGSAHGDKVGGYISSLYRNPSTIHTN